MKIVIWGTGKKSKELLGNLKACEVIGYIETMPKKSEFMGKKICKLDEIMQYEFDLLIVAVRMAGEIEDLLINKPILMKKSAFLYLENLKNYKFFYFQYRLLEKVVDRTFLEECSFWQREILRYSPEIMLYRSDLTYEEKQLLDYAKCTGLLKKFNYDFVSKYEKSIYEINNAENGMLYINYHGWNIFFPRSWNRKKILLYWAELMLDNDRQSPLKEEIEKEYVNGVLVQIDYAVPLWLIRNFAICKEAYIINPLEEWQEALKMTFQSVGDKCKIVSYIEEISEREVDYYRINVSNIVLNNIKKVLEKCKINKFIVTTYYNETDYENVKELLEMHRFVTEASKGYVYYPYNEKVIGYHTFRKGILKGEHRNESMGA